jgi:hypothetical protein
MAIVKRMLHAAALASALLGACTDLRVKEGIYTTVEDARSSGAVAAGWLPQGIPAGATDVRVGYVPDGRRWGVFTFASKEGDAVRALIGSEITANPPACEAPGRLEWWPRLLRTPVDVDRLHSTGFRIYADRAGQNTFAINWGQGRAYYWRG